MLMPLLCALFTDAMTLRINTPAPIPAERDRPSPLHERRFEQWRRADKGTGSRPIQIHLNLVDRCPSVFVGGLTLTSVPVPFSACGLPLGGIEDQESR
jgi:hypothetical protein